MVVPGSECPRPGTHATAPEPPAVPDGIGDLVAMLDEAGLDVVEEHLEELAELARASDLEVVGQDHPGIVHGLAEAIAAITGALAAGRKRMDIFGVVVLGCVTAMGGGTLRVERSVVRGISWACASRNPVSAARSCLPASRSIQPVALWIRSCRSPRPWNGNCTYTLPRQKPRRLLL